MTDTAHLLSLPSDLLIQEILARLSFRPLITCLRTCKHLQSLITSSPLLLYTMELDIAGLIDNPRCPYSLYPITTRLEMLKEREKRWLRLIHAERKQVRVPPNISGHYDLGGGLCILGKMVGEFAQGTCSLTLPSSSHSSEAQGSPSSPAEWIQFDLGEHILDYGFALEEHDLAAFVTCIPQTDGTNPTRVRIHLIQFSTHTQHPLARHPIFELPISDIGPGDLRADVKISGNNLAAVIGYQSVAAAPNIIPVARHGLSAWNWKTGQGMYLEVNSPDVTFLAENLIANPNVPDRTLDVYHIPAWEGCRMGGSSEPEPLKRIYRLSLPDLNPSGYIWGIRIRCDPSPLTLSRSALSPQLLPHNRPFSANPSAAIVQILLDIANFLTGVDKSFTIIVRRQTLLTYYVRKVVCAESDLGWNATMQVEPPPVPWSEWGPDGTRCFPIDFNRNPFINQCYGERWVYIRPGPHPDPGEPPARWIELFDFNQERVSRFRAQARARRDSNTQTSQNSHSTIYTGGPPDSDSEDGVYDDDPLITHVELLDADQPNMFPAFAEIFNDDLYSRLPCLRMTYPPPGRVVPQLEDDSDSDHSVKGSRNRKRDRFVRWLGKKIQRKKKVSPPSSSEQWPEDPERGGNGGDQAIQPRYRAWDWDGVMIDDQRVIGTRDTTTNGRPSVAELDVLYFG